MIILEFTTYPGMTEEVIRPILEEGDLKAVETSSMLTHPSGKTLGI